MLREPARRGHNSSSMMTSNVIKRPQFPISPANHHQRLPSKIKSKKLPHIGDLVYASHSDPVAAEHLLPLQSSNTLVQVPRGRDRGSVLQRRFLVIKSQHVSKGIIHKAILSLRAAARMTERCPRQ